MASGKFATWLFWLISLLIMLVMVFVVVMIVAGFVDLFVFIGC